MPWPQWDLQVACATLHQEHVKISNVVFCDFCTAVPCCVCCPPIRRVTQARNLGVGAVQWLRGDLYTVAVLRHHTEWLSRCLWCRFQDHTDWKRRRSLHVQVFSTAAAAIWRGKQPEHQCVFGAVADYPLYSNNVIWREIAHNRLTVHKLTIENQVFPPTFTLVEPGVVILIL